jgi:type I restriction enzyme S subunit
LSYEFDLPPLPTQRAIAATLSCLDDKIELNRCINANLEAQAQAIFKSWFVDFGPFNDGKFVDSELGRLPKGWKVRNLADIAGYLNGLAMQKYRPSKTENGIPVLKIRELRQGVCDTSSDLCSENVDDPYIINDGDIIFSWSGSLLVDIWCGGKCGLNQHLFKITSKKYDKWYYLLWTKYHLDNFISIAEDKATTMGHIKREHLKKSLVLIPDDASYEKISLLMQPIISAIIANRVQSRILAAIRDTLLPKLMNGEIEVEND